MEIRERNISSVNNFLGNQFLCKIKFEAFGDYKAIGALPATFSDLIIIVSRLLYPQNFSINYYSDEMTIVPIDNATTYKNLLRYSRENSMTEIKFFAVAYEAEEEEKGMAGRLEYIESDNNTQSEEKLKKMRSNTGRSFKNCRKCICRGKKIFRERKVIAG